jgi:thiamine-monophosphate kinase
MSASDIGRKLVAVNVSDLAAMGAQPSYGLLSACLPNSLAVSWVKELITAIGAEAVHYGFSIAGGDLTASPGPIALNLALTGELFGAVPILRSTAQPGDRLFVTGTLGGSAYGLRQLSLDNNTSTAPRSVAKHRVPTARLDHARTLALWGQCHAMMDISDGLAMDATRMAQSSQVSLAIDLETLPMDLELQQLPHEDALELAIFGGEDYELLFAAPTEAPVKATCIGVVEAGAARVYWTRNGQAVELSDDRSFRHFKTRSSSD